MFVWELIDVRHVLRTALLSRMSTLANAAVSSLPRLASVSWQLRAHHF